MRPKPGLYDARSHSVAPNMHLVVPKTARNAPRKARRPSPGLFLGTVHPSRAHHVFSEQVDATGFSGARVRLAVATLKVLEATSHSCSKQVRLKRLTHTWRMEGSQIYTLRQAGKGNRLVTGGRVVAYEYVNGVWPTFTFTAQRCTFTFSRSVSVSVSLSGSKSTVAPTQWLAATSVMMAAIPIPIPMAIAMAPQWNP